jgi:40S ribosome biogenesis protein Tsr1 and BMS1 C-terminal
MSLCLQVFEMLAYCMQDRFQRYRGLKSMRSSPWDARNGLPHDYTRIFAFENIARTRKLVVQATQHSAQVRN